MNNTRYKSFLKIAGICSVLGAVTTSLLIFLPNPVASDFESQTLLFENKLYLTKLWILFIHPQVNIIASLGIAYLLLRKYPAQMIIGSLFLLVWAYTEMSQQSLLIDTLNQIWRPNYVDAEGEIAKNMFKSLINAANGISDSKYFLVIYGFGLGSLLFGTALIQENGLARWIGASLLFIGILSLCSFIRYYLGVTFLNKPVNWAYEWVYSYLQPIVRIAIGIWIFKEIKAEHNKNSYK
ncbi:MULTISPECIES: hypothetical protein [Flavobacteriaceae]|uniref:hypothetical protein n=1 Tax=Flavobacteriaceae TaxID=49546 RepID=UPI001490E5DF|nr:MULTISPECIES: hypothetical protein [Allomuricauda]MDC6365568.1 hypothetical protein [Muricauda sp. AC10]